MSACFSQSFSSLKFADFYGFESSLFREAVNRVFLEGEKRFLRYPKDIWKVAFEF